MDLGLYLLGVVSCLKIYLMKYCAFSELAVVSFCESTDDVCAQGAYVLLVLHLAECVYYAEVGWTY